MSHSVRADTKTIITIELSKDSAKILAKIANEFESTGHESEEEQENKLMKSIYNELEEYV